MSGTSSVGQGSVYEAGDKQSELDTAERYSEGVPNSHKPNDSKDERSIANRLANEESKEEEDTRSEETKELQKDPTLPARNHGNEPSKGAKIDKEIMGEEQEELRRKGKA
ncbi:MAG: hypothetical protein MMC33_001157 [Icmadophila ericetorum]|nr:hypothetical protein [Icmadophila ericetorum]